MGGHVTLRPGNQRSFPRSLGSINKRRGGTFLHVPPASAAAEADEPRLVGAVVLAVFMPSWACSDGGQPYCTRTRRRQQW